MVASCVGNALFGGDFLEAGEGVGGEGLRPVFEDGRRVADLLAGLLPVAHGGQVVAHELLYERPRLGELLLGRHRGEGEAEEEGEEGEEEFHWGYLFLAV